jgi:hypothetical protein
MKKLEKIVNAKTLDISKVWGGTAATQCYTYTENKNMSDAGYCDIVFKDDNT